METWKQVDGWDGYEVSDLGRVKSFQRKAERILIPCDRGFGYLAVKLCSPAGSKTVQVHHLVSAAFIGPRPDGLQINHKNGVKTDNAADNLEYVTPSENIQHAFATGLSTARRGTDCTFSRLTDEEVLEIREARYRGDCITTLANKYGVTTTLINRIAHGKCWKHVGGPLSHGARPAGLVDTVKRLRADGLQYNEIAERVGRHYTTISKILKAG